MWHYPEHYGYSRGETSSVWESIKADPKFWQNLPPYTDTKASLAYLSTLRSNHDIYFVTSRVGIKCKLQTERWLRRYGFDDATVLISSQKGAVAGSLNCDAYVDDRWENALDVMLASPRTKSFLLVRPWNQGHDTAVFDITRVSTVVGFVDSLLGAHHA